MRNNDYLSSKCKCEFCMHYKISPNEKPCATCTYNKDGENKGFGKGSSVGKQFIKCDEYSGRLFGKETVTTSFQSVEIQTEQLHIDYLELLKSHHNLCIKVEKLETICNMLIEYRDGHY